MGLHTIIKCYAVFRHLALASFFALILLTILLLHPLRLENPEANSATGTAKQSETVLTFTNNNNSASVDVPYLTDVGVFATSTTEEVASFSVTTNNYTGYSLSIIAEDETGELVNSENSAGTLGSISAPLTAEAFASQSSTALNNKWGYKPNKYMDGNNVINNTGDNAKYLPAPTTTPTLLDKTDAANAEDTENEYTISLGVRADRTAMSGTYAKTFILMATANPVGYSVTFDANTADTVTGMPDTLAGTTSVTSINIPNDIPTRTYYTFLGWCNRKDTINSCPEGGLSFAAGGSYGIDQTEENETTLYAMWQPNLYMQDVATWGKNLSIGQSVQAIDRRDNKIYWVTKEETDPANPRAEIDQSTGKAFQIWMTQNLDLDLDVTKTYTHADTDLGYTANDPSATWTPANPTVATDALNATTWSDDVIAARSYDWGDTYVYASGTSTTDISYNNLKSCTDDDHLAEDCIHYFTGNRYNWPAAIASNSANTIGPVYTTAPNSICPAGWRLPVGLTAADGYSDYDYLLYGNGITVGHAGWNASAAYVAGGLNKVRTAPLWFLRAGDVGSGGTKRYQGVVGDYWSGTTGGDNSGSIYLGIGSEYAVPAAYSAKSWGYAVRCIARTPTLQAVDEWDDALAIGDTRQAIDIRDGKLYWVAKLETDPANPNSKLDSETNKAYQIWMTQDLDYDLKTTEPLTPATSDVTSTVTPLRSTVATGTLSSANWIHDGYTPYSYDPGEIYDYMDANNIASDHKGTLADCVAQQGAYACSHYHVGNLYNWTAAIGSNNSSSITANYQKVSSSICPAGWQLPDGPTSANSYRGDLAYLLKWNNIVDGYGGGSLVNYINDGLTKVRKSPLYISFAGALGIAASGPEYNSDGSTGTSLYWSNTSAGEYAWYTRFLIGTQMRPLENWSRHHGFSVRCLAR